MTVKVRRVGNSNVVTLPRELERYGVREGATFGFVPLRTGEILLVPADRMEEYIQKVGADVVERYRGGLEKLEAHDRGQ
jgi:antitoxin component of MazEF toxin-antitoxin module